MEEILTINNLRMIVNGEYCWRIVDVYGVIKYELILGDRFQGDDNQFNFYYSVDRLFIRLNEQAPLRFNIPFEEADKWVNMFKEEYDLHLMPIYHISTVKTIANHL